MEAGVDRKSLSIWIWGLAAALTASVLLGMFWFSRGPVPPAQSVISDYFNWFQADAFDISAQKFFYLIFCALTVLGAWWLGSFSKLPAPALGPAVLGLLLAVRAVPFLYGDPKSAWQIGLLAAVFLAWSLKPLGLSQRFVRKFSLQSWIPNVDMSGSQSQCDQGQQPQAKHFLNGLSAARWAIPLAVVVGWSLLLIPSDTEFLARQVGYDVHPTAFVLGPATYFGHHLLPGPDYFAQYGLGPATVFSWFLSPDPQKTLQRYIVFMVSVQLFFVLSTYFLLKKTQGGSIWALLTTLVIGIFFFHNPPLNPADPVTHLKWFYDPSSWAPRLALMAPFTWLLARSQQEPGRISLLLWTSLTIGLGIYWCTETGVYMLVTGLGLSFLAEFPRPRFWWRAGVLFVGSLLGLMTVAYLVIGVRGISIEFLVGMFEPIYMYTAGGSGNRYLSWAGTGDLVRYLMVPAVSCVTAGVFAVRSRRAKGGLPFGETVIAILSIFGCLLFYKFINRGISVLWYFNSAPLVIVALYWLKRYLDWASPRIADRMGLFRTKAYLLSLATFPMIALILILMTASAPVRKDIEEVGLHSWWQYPSLAVSLVTNRDYHSPIELNRPAPKDVDMIRELAGSQDRIAIITQGEKGWFTYDWAYHAALGKPSTAFYLPTIFLHRKSHFPKSFAGAKYIFLDLVPLGHPAYGVIFPEFRDMLNQMLERDYEFVAAGKYIKAYRLKAALGN